MNIFKLRQQHGLSLIEIMVAFSILTMSFIAIMYAFPFGLSISKTASNASAASYLAQGKMEELQSLDYDDVSVGTIEAKHRLSDDSADYLYSFQRATTVNYVDSNLDVVEVDQGLKRITVIIYYTEIVSKTEKSYSTVTLINQN